MRSQTVLSVTVSLFDWASRCWMTSLPRRSTSDSLALRFPVCHCLVWRANGTGDETTDGCVDCFPDRVRLKRRWQSGKWCLQRAESSSGVRVFRVIFLFGPLDDKVPSVLLIWGPDHLYSYSHTLVTDGFLLVLASINLDRLCWWGMMDPTRAEAVSETENFPELKQLQVYY